MPHTQLLLNMLTHIAPHAQNKMEIVDFFLVTQKLPYYNVLWRLENKKTWEDDSSSSQTELNSSRYNIIGKLEPCCELIVHIVLLLALFL